MLLEHCAFKSAPGAYLTHYYHSMQIIMLHDHPGSGVTGGGRGEGGRGQSAPPPTSDREISADLSGKKRQGKNGKRGKMEKKRRKIVKGKMEEGKSSKMRRRPFFFSFLFLFCFVLFCFLLFTFFQNDENLFWVHQNGNFYREKGIHAGKKSGKMTLPSQKKKFLLRPCILEHNFGSKCHRSGESQPTTCFSLCDHWKGFTTLPGDFKKTQT